MKSSYYKGFKLDLLLEELCVIGYTLEVKTDGTEIIDDYPITSNFYTPTRIYKPKIVKFVTDNY